MTIVNVYADENRALIAADTHFAGPGGTFEGCKLLPLPHLNAVVAARGYLPFIATVFSAFLTFGRDFDAIGGNIPSVMDQIRRVHGASWEGDQEIFVVGWSRSRGRMALMQFRLADGFQCIEHPVPGVSLAPWDAAWGELPEPGTVPEMIRTMRAQHQRTRALFDASVGCGGSVICAELRPTSVSLSAVAEL